MILWIFYLIPLLVVLVGLGGMLVVEWRAKKETITRGHLFGLVGLAFIPVVNIGYMLLMLVAYYMEWVHHRVSDWMNKPLFGARK